MTSSKSLDYQEKLSQAGMMIGVGKSTRRAYGFDEIALVPGSITCDPEICDVSVSLAYHKLEIPIFASAMDSVVDGKMAIAIGKLGGLGVLNLQGLQTRYEDTAEAYQAIADCDNEHFVELMQKLYTQPVLESLVQKRIEEVKKAGVLVAASVTPNFAEKFGPAAVEAGLGVLVVQSTVTGLEHKSALGQPSLNLSKFTQKVGCPVIVGNCVTYQTALELMETGVAGILVGVGPGAACTSRGVLGSGVPMATAIADCAGARQAFASVNGVAPIIIADGGMAVGGDICKAIACGADAVMIGSPLAR